MSKINIARTRARRKAVPVVSVEEQLYQRMKRKLEREFPNVEERLNYINSLLKDFSDEEKSEANG